MYNYTRYDGSFLKVTFFRNLTAFLLYLTPGVASQQKLSRFKSPIILILIFATFLSIFLRDATGSVIRLTIILASGLMGFWQEQHKVTSLPGGVGIVEESMAAMFTSLEVPDPISVTFIDSYSVITVWPPPVK